MRTITFFSFLKPKVVYLRPLSSPLTFTKCESLNLGKQKVVKIQSIFIAKKRILQIVKIEY